MLKIKQNKGLVLSKIQDNACAKDYKMPQNGVHFYKPRCIPNNG